MKNLEERQAELKNRLKNPTKPLPPKNSSNFKKAIKLQNKLKQNQIKANLKFKQPRSKKILLSAIELKLKNLRKNQKVKSSLLRVPEILKKIPQISYYHGTPIMRKKVEAAARQFGISVTYVYKILKEWERRHELPELDLLRDNTAHTYKKLQQFYEMGVVGNGTRRNTPKLNG